MSIGELQAYAYFAVTALWFLLLCAYFYHLYTAKKKEGKDYEKYSSMMLNDSITDSVVEKNEIAKTK
jgi:cytochrome c oxidase cbb3-type subunit 4